MTKFEQAEYLVNLLAIIDSKETAGQPFRSGALAKEYTKTYDEFIATIRKDHENETRPKPKLDGCHEGRAQVTSNQPSPSSNDRHSSAPGFEPTSIDSGPRRDLT